MTIAYIDAASGVSGDMFLGALVDAGVSIRVLQAAVDRLGVAGLRLEAAETRRAGVRATKVDVTYPHQHEHRGLHDVLAIIAATGLPAEVLDAAGAVFRRLAVAEAAAHEVSVDEVHFHEVGAADALADVLGTVVGLHELGVERLLCGSVNVGSGSVECAHGTLPVPAPATARLLEGWEVHVAGPARELTTPTGAALVTALGGQVSEPPELSESTRGRGAGAGDPPGWANVLRLVVGAAR